MELSAIATKIKALLAKAASVDQAEAELFFAKAHELMEKHQISMEDLEKDDPVAEDRVYRRNNPDGVDWDFSLIFAVAKYFGCKAIRIELHKGYEAGLVGRESARVTATEMHKYLIKTVRALGRKAAAEFAFPKINRWGEREGYMNADQCARRIGNALRERLNHLAAQSKATEASTASSKNALVTVDRVLAVYKELHPDAKPINGTSYTNNAARKIAAGVSLNLQATGGPATLRLK